ncbi:DUF4235 domain-containing protein [Streptomyces violaceus]|uniref:DUF4235 domain-containing protein n=1 Tax=Streptomyces violaceus TaxID=1936 RepID=A0ABY9UA12_STRVL|nr:DUF4235 domain-containing protein [Streptomyces janthinus]WND19430.1 DUF4235 domain-containing protein [Streptomyces janthinus]GGS60869.1 membrane protein [Streptomyces janthinus]
MPGGADETSKIVYKPVGPALGAVSGVAAGGLFKQVWKQLGHDDAPDATDEERTWREVIRAAVPQGAIFAGAEAAVDRGGAAAARRLTGTWPG